MNEKLIAEARNEAGVKKMTEQPFTADLINRLADALEAAAQSYDYGKPTAEMPQKEGNYWAQFRDCRPIVSRVVANYKRFPVGSGALVLQFNNTDIGEGGLELNEVKVYPVPIPEPREGDR